ncbi:MAG: VWA domain-containing protein [Kofleriaceae bacterium]
MARTSSFTLASVALVAACAGEPLDPCLDSTDPACAAACDPGAACGDGGMCGDDGVCVGGDDLAPPDDCAAVQLTTSRVVPTIELLIDQSGSMDSNFGGSSRYAAVRRALVSTSASALGVVTEYQDRAYFGASLYTDGSSCPRLRSVSSGRSLGNRDAIADLINDNGPGGETPTGQAIEKVVADFAAHPPVDGSPGVIILATDGEPDVCSDGGDESAGRARSVAAAQAAYAAGLELYVLSVGNGVANSHLQKVANAGVGLDPATGDAPYFVANDAAELAAQLGAIVGGVVSCEVDLSAGVSADRAGSGTVTLNGVSLVYGTDWELADADTLRLLGAACDTLQSAPEATVTASFPCGVVID